MWRNWERWVWVAKRPSLDEAGIVNNSLGDFHAFGCIVDTVHWRRQLPHIIICPHIWGQVLRTHFGMNLPSGLRAQSLFYINSFLTLLHPISFPLPPSFSIIFYWISFNISIIWSGDKENVEVPSLENSVLVQFNFCISFHFFIALQQGKVYNSVMWPRNKFSCSTIY